MIENGGLTVGDRLGRIENRLDQLVERMGGLAQEADLRSLTARLEVIERDGSRQARQAENEVSALTSRVTALETERAVLAALRGNRRMMVTVLLAMAGWGSVVLGIAAFLAHR